MWRCADALGPALGLAAVLALCPAVRAETPRSAESPTVRKTKSGLHFQVPPDWPIEERNGAVGPIPVEEYLSMKFSAVEARLRNLEAQMAALDVRLRVLEEAAKQSQALKSAGAGEGGTTQ